MVWKESATQRDIEVAYAKFARYYRVMLKGRGHFESQVKLFDILLSRYAMPKTARILDAACGTGDVVADLYAIGYSQVAGTDASKDMLAQAQVLQGLGDVSLQACRWQELDRYFVNHGSYDVVFILGHSLPHAKKDEIPAIVRNIYGGLNLGGIFAFDMRMWTRVQDGSLIQLERPVGVFRWLGKFELERRWYWVDDYCKYENGRQCITYRFRRIRDSGLGWDHEERLTVSYALFEPEEAQMWLQDAGFQRIEIQQSEKWPYLVVVGEKN